MAPRLGYHSTTCSTWSVHVHGRLKEETKNKCRDDVQRTLPPRTGAQKKKTGRHPASRQRFTSKDSSPKKSESRIASPCADGSVRQEGHAPSRELGASTRSGNHLHWARREKAELQTFLRLIATPWKQGKIWGVCLGNAFIATTSRPENICMYRESHHSEFRQNTLTS